MEIPEIEAHLASDNPQMRMRGITALRAYNPEIAVPLLTSRIRDGEIMVRSFVAMGLGYKRNTEAFTALTLMLQDEKDSNVQAEAAGALCKYGAIAVPHVVQAFYDYPHWLMRLSILLALADMDVPETLFKLCLSAFGDADATVKETAIQCMAYLAGTPYEEDALRHLLVFALSDDGAVRRQAAISLRRFPDLRSEAALVELRNDVDHRVVAAVLEGALASQ
jgi:HEAT repeat protein